MGRSGSLLIRNGHIWESNSNYRGDVFTEGGKIVALGKNLAERVSADETINAEGLFVLPGGIDVHTHMELPFMGTKASDSFETGTLAGLHGGTTAIIDFAIQDQGDSLASCMSHWHEKAAGHAVSDYSFHCAVTDFNPSVADEIPGIIASGVTSFKTFMAYKGALMIDDRMMLGLMDTVQKHGGMITVHAENGNLVDHLTEQLSSSGKTGPKWHQAAHAELAEAEACSRAMDLAWFTGVPLYIVHTSCEQAMERIRRNYSRGQNTWVETCTQYLTLDAGCYEKEGFEGAKYVLSPPLRDKKNQEFLWASLEAGHIHTVATDHCPFNFHGQKDMGKDHFSKIPNGIPGIEHRLEILFSEGVVKNRLSMNRFVDTISTRPASIFGLKNKGSLSPGKDADIVLFDPKEEHTVSVNSHHHRVDYSAWEGLKLQGRVKTVIANGRVAIRDGSADQTEKGCGQFVPRSKPA